MNKKPPLLPRDCISLESANLVLPHDSIVQQRGSEINTLKIFILSKGLPPLKP